MPIPVNISASRGAKILGISKWGTPVDVWLEIMEGLEPGFCAKNNYELPEFPDNASIRWGLAFEDAIVKLAEDKADEKIVDRELLYTHSKYDFITCHIDGKYFIINPLRLHEGKTTTIFSYNAEWGEPGTDRVPLDYRVQTEHQALCTGAKEIIISVLVFPRRPEEWEEMGWIPELSNDGESTYNLNKYDKNNNAEFSEEINPCQWAEIFAQAGYFHQYTIKADCALQTMMLDYYVNWWEKHVINKIPPEPKTVSDVKKLIKEPVGTIICPEELERWAKEYKMWNEEISRATKRKEQIKTHFLKYGHKMQGAGNNPKDDDSVEKWIFQNEYGEKLFSYNGKRFG